jgi:hypothetical protein
LDFATRKRSLVEEFGVLFRVKVNFNQFSAISLKCIGRILKVKLLIFVNDFLEDFLKLTDTTDKA